MDNKRIAEGNYNSEAGYRYWCTCMRLGERTGCHQKPERSFFIRGYQMPVCARCCGVILGYVIALPVFLLSGFHLILSLAGGLVMLTDWLVQASGAMKSNNRRRLVTGILGGFGIMSLQLYAISKVIASIRINIRNKTSG